jgi:hypothetical protein
LNAKRVLVTGACGTIGQELMNTVETRRSWKFACYFLILPAFADTYRQIDEDCPGSQPKEVPRTYQSPAEPQLTKARSTRFLEKNSILISPTMRLFECEFLF